MSPQQNKQQGQRAQVQRPRYPKIVYFSQLAECTLSRQPVASPEVTAPGRDQGEGTGSGPPSDEMGTCTGVALPQWDSKTVPADKTPGQATKAPLAGLNPLPGSEYGTSTTVYDALSDADSDVPLFDADSDYFTEYEIPKNTFGRLPWQDKDPLLLLSDRPHLLRIRTTVDGALRDLIEKREAERRSIAEARARAREWEDLLAARVHYLVDTLPGVHHCPLEHQAEANRIFTATAAAAAEPEQVVQLVGLDMYLVRRGLVPARCRAPGGPEGGEMRASLEWLYNLGEETLRMLHAHDQREALLVCGEAQPVRAWYQARGEARRREGKKPGEREEEREEEKEEEACRHGDSPICEWRAHLLPHCRPFDPEDGLELGLTEEFRTEGAEFHRAWTELTGLLKTMDDAQGQKRARECFARALDAAKHFRAVVGRHASYQRAVEERERLEARRAARGDAPLRCGGHLLPLWMTGYTWETPRSLYDTYTGDWWEPI